MKSKQCENLSYANGVLDMVVEKIMREVTLSEKERLNENYVKKALINQRNTLVNLSNTIEYYIRRAKNTKEMISKYKKLSLNKNKSLRERQESNRLLSHFKKSLKTDYSDIVFNYIQQSRIFLTELDDETDGWLSKRLITMEANFTLFITAKELLIDGSANGVGAVILSLVSAKRKLLTLSKKVEDCYKRSFSESLSAIKLPDSEDIKERIELDNRLLLNRSDMIYTFIPVTDSKTLLNSSI